jgi:ectoine hydroxylase-related dioxygenase (phytanoyl-CoA dioxygenase family)
VLLTCWIALDDVTEANGTVYLLPYSRAGTRDVITDWPSVLKVPM